MISRRVRRDYRRRITLQIWKMGRFGQISRSQAGLAPVLAAIILIATWLILTRIAWIHFGDSEDDLEGKQRESEDKRQDSISDWKRKQKGTITQSEAWDMYKVGCYTYMASGEIDLLTNHKALRALECKQRLPQALVIGVRGCDSFILTKILGLHPSVISHSESHLEPSIDLDSQISKWRRKQPFSSRFQMTVEHSPAYADDHDLLEGAIQQAASGIKVVIVIRDPVARIISEIASTHRGVLNLTLHSMQPTVFQNKNETVSNEEMIPYNHQDNSVTVENTLIDRYNRVNADSSLIQAGVYYHTIKKLQTLFDGNGSYLVIDRDDFVHQPLQTLARLETFLGIKQFFRNEHFEFHDQDGRYCVNVERRPDTHCVYEMSQRHLPIVDENIIEKLKQYYDEYDLKLAGLLQRNFSWMQ
ncbi:heparan sulfate glucosamine 3-O-sulfotransferase 1-like [Lytechinus variegatus]|uniref:heparan sulfate glucosamine 3-O-sulfotransferase 1-like n=1 Tax=Lytechinus variegatus TaxID=7654 RepID=UPI001BB2B4BF|nr:heparan sulfate glucosamine 3-O-sulfotransferase 1-like [Lytechinus variegatus]